MEVKKFPLLITPELAEETGWHIGDGSMNYYKGHSGKEKGVYQLRGHIEDDKPHYLQRIKPIFDSLYGTDISLREMPSTRVFGFQIWSNDLVKFKESLGLKCGPKLDVIIPDIFLANDELKASVIKGIFDTDGCVYLVKKKTKFYPRMEINTICLPLACQISKLFFDLGLRNNVNKSARILKGKRKQPYKVVVNGEEMFHKFMKIINPKNPKHQAKYELYRKGFKWFKANHNTDEPVVQPG